MDDALKSLVVPTLRNHGFTGSLPYFRRGRSNRIDLVTFQFDRAGGGLVIEIAHCGVEGITLHWGKQVPPTKMTAWDLRPDKRTRIKARDGSGTDSWFRFDATSYQEVARQVALRLSERLIDSRPL